MKNEMVKLEENIKEFATNPRNHLLLAILTNSHGYLNNFVKLFNHDYVLNVK